MLHEEMKTTDQEKIERPVNKNHSSSNVEAINNWVPHDIVLKDAWFPLTYDSNISDKPTYRAVYSKPFWIWKEQGKIVVTEFHPSDMSQSEGSQYTNGTGYYPSHERYGYVWAWYGNPNNADIRYLPNIPFLPPKGGLPKYMKHSIRFDCTAALTLENLVDLTHSDILHADLIGNENAERIDVEVITTSETITMIRSCKNKQVAPILRWFGGVHSKTQDVRQVIKIYARSHVALVYGSFTPGYDIPVFHPSVPETMDRTRQENSINMNHIKGPFRFLFPTIGDMVAKQDMVMTTPQSSRYIEPTQRRDLHSRFDKPGQEYRKLMNELAARQSQGDFAYRDDGVLSEDCSELLGMKPGQFSFN